MSVVYCQIWFALLDAGFVDYRRRRSSSPVPFVGGSLRRVWNVRGGVSLRLLSSVPFVGCISRQLRKIRKCVGSRSPNSVWFAGCVLHWLWMALFVGQQIRSTLLGTSFVNSGVEGTYWSSFARSALLYTHNPRPFQKVREAVGGQLLRLSFIVLHRSNKHL